MPERFVINVQSFQDEWREHAKFQRIAIVMKGGKEALQ